MTKPLSNQDGHGKPQNHSLKSRQLKGIRMRKWGKWVSEIRMPNSRGRIWPGSYDTPEKAAHAKFNFPCSLPEIPCTSSLSPPQIQASAAKFTAEEFRLSSEEDVASSSTCSEAESGVECQEISVEQGPPFWDSLLEDLDSCDSITLEDFPPLDMSYENFGVLFKLTEDLGHWGF